MTKATAKEVAEGIIGIGTAVLRDNIIGAMTAAIEEERKRAYQAGLRRAEEIAASMECCWRCGGVLLPEAQPHCEDGCEAAPDVDEDNPPLPKSIADAIASEVNK